MIWKSIKNFWQPWGYRGCPHQKTCVCLLLFDQKRPKAVVRPWLMLQKKMFYGIWKVYTWAKKIWLHFISTSTHDLRTASENRSKTYGAPCTACQNKDLKCYLGILYQANSRVRLTLSQKMKTVEESKRSDFSRKKICEEFGSSKATISQILKNQKNISIQRNKYFYFFPVNQLILK